MSSEPSPSFDQLSGEGQPARGEACTLAATDGHRPYRPQSRQTGVQRERLYGARCLSGARLSSAHAPPPPPSTLQIRAAIEPRSHSAESSLCSPGRRQTCKGAMPRPRGLCCESGLWEQAQLLSSLSPTLSHSSHPVYLSFTPVSIWSQYPVIPVHWVPSGWLCPNQRAHWGS
ncbi:hypothetical protein EYF80_051945 [Liparis tanakae]|uniref:Uncharacterized protein n=1 Tax=Liparis tanakae TaxID=230148 RepID=A0A4Z2FAU2_9TELE|nr:hypothetical protein EYF80_051945 [Liparis tanakae]